MDRFNRPSGISRLGLVIASGTLVALAGCGKSGEDAPSAATAAVAAAPAPEPAGPQIPKSFQGVWELTAEACATAVELGGVTDAGVQILGAEIAEYEEGCTLKSVSATGDSARSDATGTRDRT